LIWNFRLDFVGFENEQCKQLPSQKTTKKTILRFFCRCDFSHSLGRSPPAWTAICRNFADKPTAYPRARDRDFRSFEPVANGFITPVDTEAGSPSLPGDSGLHSARAGLCPAGLIPAGFGPLRRPKDAQRRAFFCA
jgi:hypothetical protein